MRQVFGTGAVRGIIDPQGAWPEENPRDILMSCGTLPMWFDQYADRHKSNPAPIPVKDWMEECYGFGDLFPMALSDGKSTHGSTITEKGTHRYPGDPDQCPMVMMKAENGAQLIQWHHGVVAFRDSKEDKWFLCRMD